MNRTIALGAAWTASAAAAVGLGFLAVSLVDASASPGTTPAAATTQRVDRLGRRRHRARTRSPPRGRARHRRRHGLRRRASAASPSLAGAPARRLVGRRLRTSPARWSSRTATQKVEVHVVCVGGAPQFSDEGLRADDSGTRRHGLAARPSSTSAAGVGRRLRRPAGDDSGRRRLRPTTARATPGRTTPAGGRRLRLRLRRLGLGDDSSGRDGGGHGSDDCTGGSRARRGETRSPGLGDSSVLLRMSTLFLRTLRDDPADAEVPSHRLLVRGGYIRRAAPGGFTWLPLGFRVFRNVERVVREEMDAMGAQEVHFPALLPREPYEATGRWTEYGAQPLPAAGPPGQRLPARPHPRGDVHAPGEGPLLRPTRTCRCRCTRSRPSTGTRRGPGPGCSAAASSR